MTRYALYWAPAPASPLWQRGCAWLGRDAMSGDTFPPPSIDGLTPPRVAQLTETARRYGFHATLKAPFALRDGYTRDALIAAVDAFAQRAAPVDLGRLVVGELDGFVALVASDPQAAVAIGAFAQRCVEAFDPFRAALTDAERARRHADTRGPRERALLERWGYPLTEERFVFHMTLTRRLSVGERVPVFDAARAWFADAIEAPLRVDAICVFEEPDEGGPMRNVHRAPLMGG
jgi:putative phosphonate metabolism protein